MRADVCCGEERSSSRHNPCSGPRVVRVVIVGRRGSLVTTGCFSRVAKLARNLHIDDALWLIRHGATWLEVPLTALGVDDRG